MKRLWLILGMLSVAAAVVVSNSSMRVTQGEPNPTVAPEVASPDTRDSTLEITYIANEGVLIASGDLQVLIDGLHREYKRSYAFLPAEERDKIEHAIAPFDGIDLILVSHVHLDHFHPESIGLHLTHNLEAVLVSSQQVVEEVAQKYTDYQAIEARVTGATPSLKEKVGMKAAGIDFEILGLGHGSGRHEWIQNLGHVISLGGKKILHVGDATPAAEIFESFNLDEEEIDIAFIPSWFLLGKEGQAIVREYIKPKHIIGVHISPDAAEKAVRQIRQAFPNAVAFTTMLEMRHY